jgi:dihydroorotate dehydrogenase
MNLLVLFCKIPFIKKIISNKFSPRNIKLSKNILGLTFSNPIGLAAGFDKNASYLDVLQTLGFGFIEIGTVTPLPQIGNDKPRLFRLPKDKAIINRMGFNNDGVKVVAQRITHYRKTHPLSEKYPMIIGGNIGKNKITPNEDAWKDYEICFIELHDVVDYFVVNVSSPNTPGLRDLQQKDFLRKILTHLQNINSQKNISRPLLLKISPDLNKNDLDEIIALALEIKLDGLVVANTTINRKNLKTDLQVIKSCGAGGLSGQPLFESANKITEYTHKKIGGKIIIIGSGGIFTSKDAKQRMDNGADLIQVWTGFIYEGPGIIRKITKGILPSDL